MSAIGNYIHITWNGYTADDGNYHRPPVLGTAEDARSKKHKEILARAKKLKTNADLKPLETKLNLLLNPGTDKDVQNMADTAKRVMEELASRGVGALDSTIKINFRNLSAKSVNNLYNLAAYLSENLKGANMIGKKDHAFMYVSTIENIAKSYNSLLNSDNIKNNADIYNKVQSNWNQIIADLNQFILAGKNLRNSLVEGTEMKNTYVKLGDYLAKEFDSTTNEIKNHQIALQAFVDGKSVNINEGRKIMRRIIKEMNYTLGLCSLISTNTLGDILEYWAATIAVLLQYEGLKKAEEFTDAEIKQMADKVKVSGAKQSASGVWNVYFASDRTVDNAYNPRNFKTIQLRNGTSAIVANAAIQKEKIDLVFNYQGKESLRISAKNSAFKVNGTKVNIGSQSFINAIQNENQYDFVNHWINLFTPKYKNIKSMKDEEEQIFMHYDEAKLYQQEMRNLMLLKMAAGDGIVRFAKNSIRKVGSANVLMVNNNSMSGGIRLINYGTFIEDIINTNNSLNYFKLENLPEQNSENKIINKKIELMSSGGVPYITRINTLIESLRTISLTATLDVSKYYS